MLYIREAMAAQGMHPNLHVGLIKRNFQQHSAKVEVSAKKMPDLHSNWRKGQRGYVKLVIPYRNIFKVNKKRRHLSLSDVFGSGNGKDCNLSVFRANLWEQSCLDTFIIHFHYDSVFNLQNRTRQYTFAWFTLTMHACTNFFKILQGSSQHFRFGAILPRYTFKIHVHWTYDEGR